RQFSPRDSMNTQAVAAVRFMKEYTVIYESGKRNWSAYVPDLRAGRMRKRDFLFERADCINSAVAGIHIPNAAEKYYERADNNHKSKADPHGSFLEQPHKLILRI